jgi:hypothetical protein
VSPRQFADLAAIVARHAEELTAAGGPDPAALHRVWRRASRCYRLWREEIVTAATPRLYAEVFAAELPMRVWCTAVAGACRDRPDRTGPAVASKVFADLLDLRCMALQALAADHGLNAAEASALDRFRRRCERWADVLLGPVADRTGVPDFAFRPERAADFAAVDDPAGETFWPLVAGGLRLAFAAADGFRGPEAIRNTSHATALGAAALGAAVLACVPAAAFAADGRLRSPVVSRVGRVVEERRPGRAKRVVRKPAVPLNEVPVELPTVEAPRPHGPISFASLRKRRPTG